VGLAVRHEVLRSPLGEGPVAAVPGLFDTCEIRVACAMLFREQFGKHDPFTFV
jgi:hypothetical protein